MEDLSISIRSNCENESENIEKFLLSFGSTKIDSIWLLGYSIKIENKNLNSEDEHSSYLKIYPCSDYFYGLREAISKAVKYILIDEILFSSKEFSSILRAAKHVKNLFLTNCKIFTDGEYELGEMEGWQIEYL